jgi:hypothetical protein
MKPLFEEQYAKLQAEGGEQGSEEQQGMVTDDGSEIGSVIVHPSQEAQVPPQESPMQVSCRPFICNTSYDMYAFVRI